jgi:predicted DNA-binding WGR domain protein
MSPVKTWLRLHALAVERDLFGQVVVVRQWGRISTVGRTRLDKYPDEGTAAEAMTKLEASKRSRGYGTSGASRP